VHGWTKFEVDRDFMAQFVCRVHVAVDERLRGVQWRRRSSCEVDDIDLPQQSPLHGPRARTRNW